MAEDNDSAKQTQAEAKKDTEKGISFLSVSLQTRLTIRRSAASRDLGNLRAPESSDRFAQGSSPKRSHGGSRGGRQR